MGIFGEKGETKLFHRHGHREPHLYKIDDSRALYDTSVYLKASQITATAPVVWTSSTKVISFAHNTTNLQITASQLNTIQDIATTSSPTFANLTASTEVRANGNFDHNGTNGVTNTAAGLITDIDISGGIITSVTKTAPVADGTYTVGARLTPTGTDGQLTITNGIITAITQAT